MRRARPRLADAVARKRHAFYPLEIKRNLFKRKLADSACSQIRKSTSSPTGSRGFRPIPARDSQRPDPVSRSRSPSPPKKGYRTIRTGAESVGGSVRIREVRMVEDVEEFGSELRGERFPKFETLGYGEIQVGEARGGEGVARRRAEGSQV